MWNTCKILSRQQSPLTKDNMMVNLTNSELGRQTIQAGEKNAVFS